MENNPQKNPALRLLIGFLVGLGAALVFRSLGWPTESVTPVARVLGELFLRGIFMLIFPLVVPMLLLGIRLLARTGQIGRIGLSTIFTVMGLTGVAASLGLLLASTLKPGHALSPETRTQLLQQFGAPTTPTTPLDGSFLLNLLPKNPFYDLSTAFTSSQQGGLLAVVVFTLLLGIALAHLPPERTDTFYQITHTLYEASLWLLQKLMYWIAPFGIAGLIFQAGVSLGGEIFWLLGAYVGVVLLGLVVQGIGVYSLFLWLFARRNPWQVLRQSSPALLVAFSSASSNATLPTTLYTALERLRLAPPVAHFILTLGATVNQNGTALYEGVTLIFLGQAFGVSFSLADQAFLIGIAILIAIGAAGVPGGSLPLLASILPFFGLPPGAIALIYGIDRLLDMARTTLNVYGDLVIASYLNRLYHGTPDHASRTQSLAQ